MRLSWRRNPSELMLQRGSSDVEDRRGDATGSLGSAERMSDWSCSISISADARSNGASRTVARREFASCSGVKIDR